MDTMDGYKVDLKGMTVDTVSYRWLLEDGFFSAVHGPEIRQGTLDVALRVKRTHEGYDLEFQMNGSVKVECDRCLALMDLPIHTEQVLTVRLGEDYDDDGEVIVIAESCGVIDVAWHMYEMAALQIPIRHVHPEGECDAAVMARLRPDEPKVADPRWAALAKLKNNNNQI